MALRFHGTAALQIGLPSWAHSTDSTILNNTHFKHTIGKPQIHSARHMQLRLNFVLFLSWWIPEIIGSCIVIQWSKSPCLNAATTRPERLIAYAGVIALTLITTAPYVPHDGLRTLEPDVDAFAWTDASREAKRAAQRATVSAPDVHQLPSVRAAPPVFSMEMALKAFAWSSVAYGFESSDECNLGKVLTEVRLRTVSM